MTDDSDDDNKRAVTTESMQNNTTTTPFFFFFFLLSLPSSQFLQVNILSIYSFLLFIKNTTEGIERDDAL